MQKSEYLYLTNDFLNQFTDSHLDISPLKTWCNPELFTFTLIE